MKVLILSILVAVCYAQTPPRPVIPETFEAEVSIELHNFSVAAIAVVVGMSLEMHEMHEMHECSMLRGTRQFYGVRGGSHSV